MTSSREAWERVLAAVEADARRAEALMQTPAEEFVESGDVLDAATVPGLPADWLLPTATTLPPLDTMPPVPPELSERILTLRSQIMRLQTELSSAMRDVARNLPRRPAAAVPVEVPAYIDRRL
jgi:hypothetical protein